MLIGIEVKLSNPECSVSCTVGVHLPCMSGAFAIQRLVFAVVLDHFEVAEIIGSLQTPITKTLGIPRLVMTQRIMRKLHVQVLEIDHHPVILDAFTNTTKHRFTTNRRQWLRIRVHRR